MSKEGTTPISEKDSRKIIDAKMAEIIYDKINKFEKALIDEIDAQTRLKAQPSKEAVAEGIQNTENNFKYQIREELANFVANDDKTKKLDPFVREEYRDERDAHIKRLLGNNVDFSGNKEELATKMNALRQQVEKSTGVAEQKPQEQVKKSKSAKVSSEESWNIIADALYEVAESKITEAEKTLGKGKELYKAQLKQDLRDEFVEAIAMRQAEYEKNGKQLDPKVVELFKENKSKIVDYIMPQAGAHSDRMITEQSEMNIIKGNLVMFDAHIAVHEKNKTFSWKKIAEACKTLKMSGLADFCSKKHLEGLAKSVSKNLNKGLVNSQKISLDVSKSKAPKHKSINSLSI